MSFAEYRTPALAHVCTATLTVLDAVQDRFLRSIGLSAREACVHFRMAPLAARRNMAMLGVIHRSAIGAGPPMFQDFFRIDRSPPPPRSPRRHHRHLVDPCGIRAQNFVLQSALGRVRLYNLLPDFIVAAPSVKVFQRRLGALVQSRAHAGCADWDTSLCWRVSMHNHILRGMRDWTG